MNHTLIRRLNYLNQDFYSITAQQFSATRQTPWAGWEQLLPFLEKICLDSTRPIRVLDIGCGNGRFAHWLSDHFPTNSFEYLGIDSSEQLLSEASQLTVPHVSVSTRHVDVVEALLKSGTFIKESAFDVIVSFGVIHHIASKELRANLLSQINAKLVKGGVGVITFWQFDHIPNLLERQFSATDLGMEELEKNDYILDWQRGVRAYRYCHLTTKAEVKELVAHAQLEVVKQFEADGNDAATNHYLVITKSA